MLLLFVIGDIVGRSVCMPLLVAFVVATLTACSDERVVPQVPGTVHRTRRTLGGDRVHDGTRARAHRP